MSKFSTLFAAATVSLVSSAFVANAETNLAIDRYVGPSHPLVNGVMIPISEAIPRVTDGRVTVEISSAPLGKSKSQWEQVQSGISDIAVQYIGWRRANVKLPAVAHIPFGVPSGEEASAALWNTYGEFFADANEFEGAKLLALVVHNGTQFYTRGERFDSVADFKNLKIRSAPGEGTQAIELLGGNPVASSGPQIFEFFSKGVVDAVLDGGHGPLAFKIVDYIEYATSVPGSLGGLVFAVYMNEDKFNALSAADQAAIEALGEEISRRGGRQFDDFAGEATQAMLDSDVEIVVPSDAMIDELKAALQPIEDAWLATAAEKGIDGAAALNFYRSQLVSQ